MKYGKLLTRAKTLSNPSWIDKWMDYNKLKELIRDIAVETGGPEARVRPIPESTATLDAKHGKNLSPNKEFLLQRSATPSRIKEIDVECAFFLELKKNLDSVAKFYEVEESSLVARSKKLKAEIDAAISLSKSSSGRVPARMSHLMDKLKVLYVDLMMLENYAVMNYGGFAKILKKHDKNTPFSTQEKYLRKMVNPCSFAFYPLLKQAIAITESSFTLLIGQSSTNDKDTSTEEASEAFNVDVGADNEKKTNNKMQETVSGGLQTRSRLNTADRQKLESLDKISGALSSGSSTANKECSSEDEDGHDRTECKVSFAASGQKRKNLAASMATNIVDGRQTSAKRRFSCITGSE